MKKYNMIDNRPELSKSEIEEGMDFNKILKNSVTYKKTYLKPFLITIAFLIIIFFAIIMFYKNSITNQNHLNKEQKYYITSNNGSFVAKPIVSVKLFLGNIEAKDELVLSKIDFEMIDSLYIKNSEENKIKIIGFTFTTLTKNGISQITEKGSVFSKDLKVLIRKIKAGQTVYFENIMIVQCDNKKEILKPITVIIK